MIRRGCASLKVSTTVHNTLLDMPLGNLHSKHILTRLKGSPKKPRFNAEVKYRGLNLTLLHSAA